MEGFMLYFWVLALLNFFDVFLLLLILLKLFSYKANLLLLFSCAILVTLFVWTYLPDQMLRVASITNALVALVILAVAYAAILLIKNVKSSAAKK